MATHEVQRHISHHANALCHFHIAASINPATDIPNVLVGTVFNIDDGNGGFVVHWLNNKEFHFTSSIEIFMQQLRKLSEKQIDHESDEGDREDEEHSQEERERGLHMKLDHELSLDRESEAGTGSSEHEDGEREGSPRTCSRPSVPMPLPTVLLDRKIEMLLTEWNKNPDMLFTIHPVDDCQWEPDSKLNRLMDPGRHMKVSSKQPLRNAATRTFHDPNAIYSELILWRPLRNAATRTFHDPNAIYSELILWRVDPIGPLSYTGGVSELARINSLHTSAFSNVAWLPTLIPSYCLGHLSSSSIYPVCLAPYLVVTTCSDNKVRFWKCSMETSLQCKSDEKEIYHWRRWPLMNDEGEDNSSTPVHQNGFVSKEFSMHVCIFECESTGGSEWALEQTIHLDDLVKVGSVLDSRWKHAVKFGDIEADSPEAEETAIQDHSAFKSNMLSRKSIVEGTAISDDVFCSPTVIQDGGLFEAAHVLSPTLPQYHPTQLLELMDLGKVRRAKAILSHLVKCIAGEVAIVRDADAGEGTKRHLSRTISVSGSTAKDTVTIGKDGTRDYTEIDSIPPLPLYALLAADQDTTYRISEESTKIPQSFEDHTESQPEDQYSELFQIQDITTDDIDLEPEKRENKSKVINLSQYGPAYFGQEHARVLSSHLMHSSLPGLTRLEQMFLVALADTVATTSTELDENRDKTYSGRDTLDECGLRYLLAMRLHTCLLTSLPPLYRVQLLHQGVSTCHFAWAFHSEAEEELINMIPAIQRGDPQWSELRAMGIGWWVRNINTLRRCIEKVAKAAFQRNNDALDAALFYLSMKKKAVVWGLFRSQHDEKMTTFFSHNFNEDRWRKAALKNAFSLLGKQRFEQSAAFFLLAGSLKDAIEVCLEKMEDIQLAMVIARLYESDFETSSTYISILNQKILGCQKDGSGFDYRRLHPDPFLRSLAYWVMKDYTRALDTLLEQTPKEDDEHQVTVKSCNPVVFSFYNYLRTHPLLIRRNLASPEGTLATVGLKTEKNFVDKINLIERKLFFTTANAHFKVGCPVLALEVLSKIPKVTKVSALPSKNDQPDFVSKKTGDIPSESKPLRDGDTSSGIDWSDVTPSQFDWSQPVVKVDEEPLCLDWGEEHDSALEEDDEDAAGLVMKSVDAREKGRPESLKASDPDVLPTPQEEDCLEGDAEVDVIAEQLKFRACLKILMTELRTLATGYEVDGGKLRFQLYNWLEKEIAALHEICNHESVIKEYASKAYSKVESDLLGQQEIVDKPDIGSYERHQIERRRLQAKREHAERRKLWLQKNQDLLRVFLSYCSLHGAQGGGLASVRMELKFLLQESQQETTVKQLQSPLPLPTTLPLLSASIAATKTVIANPVLYLNNHIHDILYTIVQMKTPPHPSTEDVKTFFTLLLAFPGPLRPLILTPRLHVNGHRVSSLINLLSSAQDEDQPKLNILLCEAVVAVYLSLLIHALATNSSNELFRLAAHPLNNRMWAAVFGGGVKLVVKPQRQSESVSAPPVPSEDIDKHRRRFNMRMLVPGRPVKDATPPPVPAERPSYKEKFIPPELSMWDYFVAKGKWFFGSVAPAERGRAQPFTVRRGLSLTAWSIGPFWLKEEQAFQEVLGGMYCSDQTFRGFHSRAKTLLLIVAIPIGPAINREQVICERSFPCRMSAVLRHLQPLTNVLQVEADLGYPGGKAKIIHKESDMIMAFSVNKANCNEIVLASTHDVQELDVTSLLACQSYIWIGEEYDRESKSSDDIDYRGSTTTLYQPSVASASQVHPPSSLPWLGSGQTSTGASVLMKRNLHNVKRMTSHPVHQYYLTGAQDGSVRMFEWTRPQQLVCFRQAGNARVTRLYFNSQGNKSWQCHTKATSDFAFVTSSSLVATSGQSNDNRKHRVESGATNRAV
ncbi:Dmx-like 2 isoform 1 [Camelus ferus]|nr:Dmx-like 2 isoform 1 [Camelus ferus]